MDFIKDFSSVTPAMSVHDMLISYESYDKTHNDEVFRFIHSNVSRLMKFSCVNLSFPRGKFKVL